MSTNTLKVSVVVCAYTLDRWIDLQGAIKSIQDQSILPAEIILVIDHNPALFRLSRETFPYVKVIENQEERGLSGARNSGIAHSTGQIVAFIDEDAIATPRWLENLTGGYQDSRVIGVGGEVKPLWAVTPPEWFPEEFNWVVGCSYRGLPETAAPVRNPIGCNMSFRREVISQVGGFRNGIGRIGRTPVGCEETEMTIRARQLKPNSTYLYQPEAVVYHKVPEWRLTARYFAYRCYAEGLSKALVTRFVGASDGLSSERRYVADTLPKGVLTGIKQSIADLQLAGLMRATAISMGLLITTAGYLVGIATRVRAKYFAAPTQPKISAETEEW